jgi:hypothetical protein
VARTPIARTALPVTGLNLTDAVYETLTLGAGNGIEVTCQQGDLLVLYNHTGGAAVYTLKIPNPAQYTDQGVTVPDKTVNVAAAKTLLYPVKTLFRQSDGDIYVDCDIAAKALVIDMP